MDKTKIFNGKLYHFDEWYPGKKFAQEMAAIDRGVYRYVRVLRMKNDKGDNGYAIYKKR